MAGLMGTVLPGIQAPRWIVFQLTEACNLRCRMCYEWGENGAYFEKKQLSTLDADVVKAMVKECAPFRPYFGLFGGEPLLHPQLETILKTIYESGCRLDIPTNGTLLEKHSELLCEFPPTRLWISLDGPERVNDRQRGAGCYAKVIRGIEVLHACKQRRNGPQPKIGVTFIVTPENYLYIEEFFLQALPLELLDHLSIELQCYATPEQVKRQQEILASEFQVFSAPCAQSVQQDLACFAGMDFESIAAQMNRVRKVCESKGIYFISYPKTIEVDNIRNYFTGNWQLMTDRRTHCSFPWIYSEISAQGEVTVCHTFYDLSVGNVNEKPLLEIWRGERLKQVRNYLRKQLYPVCTACSRYYADSKKH